MFQSQRERALHGDRNEQCSIDVTPILGDARERSDG